MQSTPFLAVCGIVTLLILTVVTVANAQSYNCSQWKPSQCNLFKDHGCSACLPDNDFGAGSCCAETQQCCNTTAAYGTTCCNRDTEKCCGGTYNEEETPYCCPVDTECCSADDDQFNLCCKPGQTCCSVQYSAQCCEEGWSCCTSPNFHSSTCCSPSQLCCPNGSGGGLCCDAATETCGEISGCVPKNETPAPPPSS